MMSMLWCHWRFLVLIPGLLLALAMPVAASTPALGAAQFVALSADWQAPLVLPALAAPARTLPWRVLLPVVVRATDAHATVRFGAGRLDGQLSEVSHSFAAGLTTLYYEVTITGTTGGRLSEQWLVRGQRQPALDRELELPPGGGSYISGITLSTSAPLPLGSYELRLLLGDQLIGTGRAEIR